jgi:hypothetical protein
MNAATTLSFRRRKDFQGLTDKYARYSGIETPEYKRNQAIKGIAPFDVVTGAMSEDYRDAAQERLNRYSVNHTFYNGDHFSAPIEDGEKKIVVNYCRPVVDKAVDFFLAKGWKVICPEGNEGVATLLNSVWDKNGRMTISQKACQFGAITGDSFWYVTVIVRNELGEELPRDEWYVKLSVLDPAYVFPIFSTKNPDEMDACLIQFPIEDPKARDRTILYSIYITADSFVEYHDEKVISKNANPFGRVNVVHCPNFIKTGSFFGQSDIDAIIDVNVEYNTVCNRIRRIINYHAEPTTIIFGARASTLERGANKVWSGLPADAKVENLELKNANLEHIYKYLEILREQMLSLSNTPQIAIDNKDYSISNTSGVAIQMMFQPLIEKSDRRSLCFTSAVSKLNQLIIIAERDIIKRGDWDKMADDMPRLMESWVEYTSPLPRDEQAELDAAVKKVELGVWSKAEAIRRVSGVKNIDLLILELIADKREELAMAYENQRAVSGERPSSLAAFLGSIVLNSDLVKVMQALLDEEEATHEEPPPAPAPAAPAPRTA